MAISLGTTSEHLLRGFDRIIGSIAAMLPTSSTPRVNIPRAWAGERGTTIASFAVDVVGGFPGSIRSGHILRGITVTITDRYIIAAEGTTAGFALPIHLISGTGLCAGDGLQPPALVVWYQDADSIGSFLLRFRGTARDRHGLPRALSMQRVLTEAGALEVAEGAFVPGIFRPWTDLDEIADDEDVLWRGTGLASVGGPFGGQLDTTDIWLTERSLIWVARHGSGMNQLPLDAIMLCRNGYSDRLSIGIQDHCGGRYDIYFDLSSPYDRSQPAARVLQFLAAAGVPVGTSTAPRAPWRAGGTRRPTDL